ncbi:MAG: Flp pilus assembly complex ATPase component TadA [Candidatus Gastranaerophilales bacterium]|nr:Flp pilus assembly complex ATPase component TadA [Candidatus Gastranaerophilales bacterium]
MGSEYISKLLNKIDLEFVKRFDRAKMSELLFVPFIANGDCAYFVVSQDSDKEVVTAHAKNVLNVPKVDFITVPPTDFGTVTAFVSDKLFSGEAQTQENNEISGIAKVKSPETKRLGEILVEENLLTEEQVQEALAESKNTGFPLGSTLVKLGYITIKQLKEALAAQMHVAFIPEEQLLTLPDSISFLPDDFVRTYKVIPLSYSSKTLTIGMVNPKDTEAINQVIGMTGLKPSVLMVTSLEYDNYIKQYYEKHANDSEAKKKSSLEKMTAKLSATDSGAANEQSLWQKVESDIEDISSDTAKYANTIVTQAIDTRASDIHIEPRLDGYMVRYRIDGTLKEIVKIPSSLESQLVSRFKVLAKMNIAEHRRPQDGNFTIKYNKQAYDFRINTLPVSGREKLVIRILAPNMRAEDSHTDKIEIAGAFPDDVEKLKFLLSAPNGIILTSGPTGSGKTTTLYSLLKTVNTPDINITTIEDPVEIRLDGVNQSPVNAKAGITFASCMRAILRQDPDIILVGEIRDYETLETAISAALTGHSVLSTIHTNSAAATVTRLAEMGAKDYLISSTLNGVLAQRLVKKLCPKCKEAYFPTEEEVKKITLSPQRQKEFMETTFYKAKGCPECGGAGYKGRLALLEVLVMTKNIKKVIASGAHDIEIEECAVKEGMRTLHECCIKHIMEGNTTIDEFVRVLGLVGE